MKDAKGHGSDPRGTHSGGVDAVGRTFDIPLSRVRPDPAFDLRGWDGDFSKAGGPKAFQPNMRTVEGNAYTVAGIRQAMRNGVEMPPIEIDRKRGVISEGHHRYKAAQLEGRKTIKAKWV